MMLFAGSWKESGTENLRKASSMPYVSAACCWRGEACRAGPMTGTSWLMHSASGTVDLSADFGGCVDRMPPTSPPKEAISPMILDSLSQANRYSGLHAIFPRVWEILTSKGLSSRPAGRYPIDGTDSYYLLVEETGKGEDAALLESHHRFIDIHVTLRGEDSIGWRPVADSSLISQPYDTAKDATLYLDRPLTWSKVTPGMMAIFFPDDAHAPLAGTGELRKAIVKIAC